MTSFGWCIPYQREGCEQAEKDESNDGYYKCLKCQKGYVLDKYNRCQYCSVYSAIINDKCINCNDVNNGGVKNCKLCQENEKGDKILCKQCDDEYILFSNSNTCLERNASKEIEEFNSCLELESKNNKLICSRCKPQFSLIQNGNEFKCIYTPTLYDSNFPVYYYYKKISPISHFGSQNIIDFLKTDYLYRRTKFYPCKESIILIYYFFRILIF